MYVFQYHKRFLLVMRHEIAENATQEDISETRYAAISVEVMGNINVHTIDDSHD